MPHEKEKYLADMASAIQRIERFVEGQGFAEYQADELLRSGVERQFEIIGEALTQLQKIAPEVAEQIPEYQRIIAFRNLLIHAYGEVDDRIVWGIVEGKLAALKEAIEALLHDH